VTISVILTANVDFPTGSTVTISGLTGTQTASSGSLAVNTSGLMGTSGVWTQSLGTLVLTAANGGTAQAAACTVTFVLQHAAAEYTPPTVSISAAINNGSTALGSIAQAAMVAPMVAPNPYLRRGWARFGTHPLVQHEWVWLGLAQPLHRCGTWS
jgi:hypothetical protein